MRLTSYPFKVRANWGSSRIIVGNKKSSCFGRQRTEQLRQSVAHPALSHLDIIEGPIGPDDATDYFDEKALGECKRKKKRKQNKLNW